MKINKIIFAFATITLILSAIPVSVSAQMSVGASYELRDEEPTSGFGFRIERELLESAPVVNLGLRAHFSYFSDENDVDYSEEGVSYSYSQDITNYDYGLAAVGGVSVGPISPYVGLGLGASSTDISRNNLPTTAPLDEEADDSSIYWNGFVGGKISVLPLQPFVEYRLEDVSDYEDELRDYDSSTGRLIFGISLSF